MEVPEAQSNILESAKQGNSRAIVELINRQLQSRGITAKASRKDDILQILLEAVEIPDQKTCCSFIEKGIIKINPQGIHTVKIYGKPQNTKVPEWNYSFQLYQDEDVFNFQDVLDPTKDAPKSPKNDSKTERGRKTFENLKRNNPSDKKIVDYSNPKKQQIIFIGLISVVALTILGLGLRSRYVSYQRAEKIKEATALFRQVQEFMDTGLAEIYTKDYISEKIGSPAQCGQTDIDRSMKQVMGGGYFETCIWKIGGKPIGAISYSYAGDDDNGVYIGIHKVDF